MGVLRAISSLFGSARRVLAAPMRPLRARYDAAQTTADNANHWANADALGAATANTLAVRKKIRERARYERANNCFCNGMVRTVANHSIGTGPRLQLQTDDEQLNQQVEAAFSAWAKRVRLADKLRQMRAARCVDGEAFAIFVNDRRFGGAVSLDLQVIECDRFTSTWHDIGHSHFDGIEYDDLGYPVSYQLLLHHPGDALAVQSPTAYRILPASQVLHWYRCDRPGQLRGIPEVTPALNMYAVLRRYTMATLHSAETAANFAVVLKTTGTVDPAEVEAFEELEIKRNAMTTMPDGWDISQLKAEQPTTNHDSFQRSCLREIARCLDMPYNIAGGDSSSYNYSSGKLDDQTWGRTIVIDRDACEATILDRVVQEWRYEAEALGVIPPVPEWSHVWHWPPDVDIDPEKEARAAILLRDAGLLTRAQYFARKQLDWREVMRQQQRENQYATELGLSQSASSVDVASSATTDEAQQKEEMQAKGGPQVTFSAGKIDLRAIAADGGLPTFSMVAYTGGKLYLSGRSTPVIVDLAGVQAQADVIPALRDHQLNQEVGHIHNFENTGREIRVSGVLSATNEHRDRVVESSRNGFVWQASVGGAMGAFEHVAAGQSVHVNGQTFVGPVDIAREAVIQEVSFVTLGADITGTTVAVAAIIGGSVMDFAQFCASKGFDESTLSAEARAYLEAQYSASNENGTQQTATSVTASAGTTISATTGTATLNAEADIAAYRTSVAAEQSRVAEINKLAAEFGMGDKAAEAIAKGTPAAQFGLECARVVQLRASRASGAGIAIHSGKTGPEHVEVLHAAACQSLGMRGLDESFKPQVLEAAHRAYRGRMGLQEMLYSLAASAGKTFSGGFRANHREVLRAAFSSTEASAIFSNIVNKVLLKSFMAVDQAWSKVGAIRSVADFKEAKSYRLNGPDNFDEVPAGGKLKHGKLSDVTYSNQAKTYGSILSVTRQDIINDDLGALQQLPAKMGHNAAVKLNKVFWTEFLSGDGSFWHTSHTTAGDTGNANKTTGALSIANLTVAEAMFLNQIDSAGNPIAVSPKLLLVPNAIKRTALEIMSSSLVHSGATTTKMPSTNTFQGNFDVVPCWYLSDATISGYSATAYYLLADPMELPVIEVAFLNGQQTPTVEEVEPDADELGMSFRAYFDFGVSQQDYRGGVKSTGA